MKKKSLYQLSDSAGAVGAEYMVIMALLVIAIISTVTTTGESVRLKLCIAGSNFGDFDGDGDVDFDDELLHQQNHYSYHNHQNNSPYENPERFIKSDYNCDGKIWSSGLDFYDEQLGESADDMRIFKEYFQR